VTTPRERIVTAALGLIAERGMAGVTRSAIAQQAGVARQTLYNHFPDVDAIVLAVVEQHEVAGMEQLRRIVAAAEGPAAQLEQLVRHSVALSGHGAHTGSLEASLSPEAQDRLNDHKRNARRLITEILESGVDLGVFRADLDVPVTATLIQQVLVAAGSAVEETGDAARVATEAVLVVLGGAT
jgi:AcrR family transcriptional regulator